MKLEIWVRPDNDLGHAANGFLGDKPMPTRGSSEGVIAAAQSLAKYLLDRCIVKASTPVDLLDRP